MKLNWITYSALAVQVLWPLGNAGASPAASFGLDAMSTGRAMAVTASADPLSAASTNPARLMDVGPGAIEVGAGVVVSSDELKVNRADAGLDTYIGMQFGVAASLPLGKFRDRLFVGADVHLPKDHLYTLYNSGASDPVVLSNGPDARRLSLDLALAVRIWERIAVGVGVYVLPDVGASVNVDFSDQNEHSYTDIKVDYRLAPTVGIYAEPIGGLHLGFAYRAAQKLSLSVPANIYISDAIGTIHTRVDGNAYAEPHRISFGISYDFSSLTEQHLLHFAANLDAEYDHYTDPIQTSARVWLYDEAGAVLEKPLESGTDYQDAFSIHTSIDWMPLDELRISVGYGFTKSAVPAQRYLFNVLDADKNQVAFGATGYLPAQWLGGLGLGLSLAAKLDFYTTRDMEKFDFLPQNPGFPSIRFEGRAFTFHAALLFRFE